VGFLSNACHGGKLVDRSPEELATYVPCPYPLDKAVEYEVMAAGGKLNT
jgi:hypothetical protein